MKNRMIELIKADNSSVSELAERYGRTDNQQLYRFRDLLLRWRQEYIAETGYAIYDMHTVQDAIYLKGKLHP